MFTRRGRVTADVGDGFVAGEAAALQTGLSAALTTVERGSSGPARVELTFATEDGNHVVIVCRNQTVGFVPPSHEESVREQLVAAGRARLETAGQIYRDAEGRRLWVGPPRSGGFPAPEPGADTLAPPRRKIFGLALPDD
ncbi:hypothetical protein CTE05_20020 [Cellulomonas terrae]|uniref:Uncharacterized protein n=2 Tax=Cellulomonas terrae TaxID=311234 RepID=A0A511JKL7_9CELL|nr:hypothetical protein CTE05_20020 [Cellulomonas terrae]